MIPIPIPTENLLVDSIPIPSTLENGSIPIPIPIPESELSHFDLHCNVDAFLVFFPFQFAERRFTLMHSSDDN